MNQNITLMLEYQILEYLSEDSVGLSYYFNGEIYSIRVYNRALTEDEILHNYNYDKGKFNLE